MCVFDETPAGGYVYKKRDCQSCECPDSRVKHQPGEDGICSLCDRKVA